MTDTPKTPPETVEPIAKTEASHDAEPSTNATSEIPIEGIEGTPSDAPHNKKSAYQLTPEMKADPVSRKLILLSISFAGLAIICIGFLTYTYYQKKHAHDSHSPVVNEEPAIVIIQKLDEIRVKLRNEQDLRAEIATECSDRATCDFVKDHPAQVRDLMIPILSAIDPDIFGNIEAKQTMRKNLVDRLNTLEMPGKVNQVHFNNFSIEGEVKADKKKHHE